MPSLSLKIILQDGAVTRVMKFPSGATVADATSMVEEKVLTGGAGKDYGLFLTSADDDLSGIWLEDPRRLDYYLLKDGDSLHYRCRVRTLRIRMLDGSLKTMQVDERKPVEDLMLEVCSKLGITNYEEYGLCREDQPMEQEAPATGTLTLKRKAKPREKDAAMQQLSKKLKTDDNVEWLEQKKTLRESSVTPTETLLLKRRLFYSDRKVDARDPVQLNLLYVQARDAVLQGRHPVTEDQDQVCKARWINIRDMMRRKIRERLRNPSHRSYNYKYEEEMSFMIPYFKDASATSEEYTDFIDEDTSCEVAMTSDVFADGLPAAQFAGIQCQVQYGDFQEDKHKPGYIENLSEFLPQQYANAWGVEKKVLREHSQHTGVSPIEAKHLYTKTARDLPTYGVTFFLVKEMQKGKKKLVPRLLGINANSILRLDETTKEVLQVWPLTQVKTYKAGKGELFTLNFGDYSEKEYCVKTNDAYRIRDILQSYIDLIRKKLAGPYNPHGDEGGVVYSATVESSKGQMMELVSHSSHKTVETSFVGPSKIISYEQGSNVQAQGAQVMTAQQVIVTSRQHNEQTATTGGVAMRGELSVNTVRKLNDLNGNAVSIVKLLTDPTEANIEEAKKIIEVISQNMPVLVEGVKQHIEKQPDEPAKKKLTFELSELIDNVGQLKQFKNPSEAQEVAMKIADLTTQMYFALDPRSKRNSDWIRRSRSSFIEDDKTQATLHRASFINSVAAANHAIEDAKDILNKKHIGTALSPKEVDTLERASRDKLAKLNAAIALFIAAHADPKNIDFEAAVNSMNTIKELLPELAKDAQSLSGAQDGKDRSALLQEMRELYDAAARICQKTGCDDLQKMHDEANNFARKSGKLVFTFGRGVQPDKENEIIHLAKEADDKANLLIATASQLADEVDDPNAPVAARAAARCGHAARGLRACAQLTASSINEPHCRSALSASAEDLKSSTKVLTDACRPLLEHPEGQSRSEAIKSQSADLIKALERLENAYSELEGKSEGDGSQAADRERRRLHFVTTLSKAHGALDNCDKILNDTRPPASKSNGSSGWYRLAELNAAIAKLVAATRDGENPDYVSADEALAIIEKSLPDLVKDSKYHSQKLPPQQREEFLSEVRALCDATRALTLDTRHGEEASASVAEFARASGKLTYVLDKHALMDKEHQIIDLAKSSCEKTSELLAHVYGLAAEVQGEAADELDAKGSQVAEAAQELLTNAQITAPTIHTAPCKNALFNSAQDLSSALQNVARIWSDACQPQHQAQEQVLREHKKAADDEIQKLIAALNSIPEYELPKDDPVKAKKRVQFAMSLSNARDAVEQAEMEIDKPLPLKPLSTAEVTAVGRSLADKLAALNAAIAALMAATQDPSNPNYEAAESSSAVIQQLVPQLVKDAKALSSSTDEATRAGLLHELRALCAATKALSTGAGDSNATELNKAVAQYGKASKKLSFICTPQTQGQDKQRIVMDKTKAVCEKSNELMAVVHQLNKPEARSDLEAPSLKVQQAAQALLTTAQLTAPSLHATECRVALHQAAADLFRAMSELENACGPRLGQAALQSISQQRKDFEDAVEELMKTIKDLEGDTQEASPQAEKQRLRFIATQAVLDKAARELNEPLKSPPLSPPQAKALQSSLADRLATLNAAIAALISSTRDDNKPDYVAAEVATATIQELMPELVKDAKVLGVGMDKAGRDGLLESMRALCDATKVLSSGEHSGKEQELNDAVALFIKASGQLVYTFNPHLDPVKEDQIIDLTKSTCLKTSELLAQVYDLAEQVGGERGEELDARGAKVADAAQNLLTTAEITAPSITSPLCQSSCLAALDALSSSVDQLALAWQPAASQKTAQELAMAKAMVDEEVGRLREALMKEDVGKLGAKEKKERMRFVTSLASTEAAMVAAEKELNKPSGAPLPPSAVASIQDSLAERLATLNAAISTLVAATRGITDHSNPDYEAAESAAAVVRKLVPDIVKDTKSLSSSKDPASSNELLAQMRALCEAMRRLSAGAGQTSPEEINKAATQFSLASGKLNFVYNPKADQKQAQQILDTCQSACVKTSEMLRHVRALAGSAGGAGVRLEQRGAAVADAARTLLTTGQLTAHSAHSAPCQVVLLNASETLSSSLQDLESAWAPIVQDPRFKASGEQLGKDQEAVEAEIVQLKALLKGGKDVKGRRPAVPIRVGSLKRRGAASSSTALDATKDFLHQLRSESSEDGSYEPLKSPTSIARLAEEKQARLNFGKCVAGAVHTINLAEDDLKKSLSSASKPRASLDVSQVTALSKQLEHKLARANAAAAHLLACRGSEKPDYQLATKCVGAVSDLIPTIVTDAKILADLKDVPTRKAFLNDTMALCSASKNLCETAKNDKKKLTEAALLFGNESSKLLYAVSTDIDPSQENQVLLRVKAVGDVACRVTAVAEDAAEQDAAVHCAAQATVFMYTAKLVAPSIQDPECQESLITASKDLSNQLKTIPTTNRPAVAKELTELEKLLEALRRDVVDGKLVKRREVLTIEDTPLRRLTAQVIEDAKQNAECTKRPAEERRAMADFANQLTDALKTMDVANARCKNEPHDMKKRADLEDAILNVQQLVLQCRPRPGEAVQQTNIVDLAVFLNDVSTAAEQLSRSANNAELTGGAAARTAAAVSAQCQKLCGAAFRGPGVDVDHAAKECVSRVQKINTAIECCAEGPEKNFLKTEARPLNESCTLLQFASQSSIATSQCAALDEALNDLADLEHRIDRMLQPREGETHMPVQGGRSPALLASRARLARAAAGARRAAQDLAPAYTRYLARARAAACQADETTRLRLADHLKKLHDRLKLLTMETGRHVVTWRPENEGEVVAIIEDILKELDNAEAVIQTQPGTTKSHIAYEDLKKLLLPVNTYKVEGDKKQLEAKLESSATKLNSMTETITLSARKPESLARSAHLTTETALQLTAIAKSMKTDEDPTKSNKIDEASQELCFVTYNLLKTAESACHDPDTFESKRRLLDACRSLTDAINKLVKTSSNADKLQSDCSELSRSLQLRQSCLQTRPTCTLPYAECVAALQTQHGVIESLKSDKPMSRQEFSTALDLLASAVGNDADYAEQCAYLLSISEQHPTLAKEGLFDTARVRRLIAAAEESCFRVTRSGIIHQAKEESSLLSKQLSDLKQAIEECSSKVSDTAVKQELLEASNKVDAAGVRLQAMLNVENVSVDDLTPPSFALIDTLSSLRAAAARPALAPRPAPAPRAQQQVDEVITQTRELLSRSTALMRVVKTAESQEAMTWVMFNTYTKGVIESSEQLLTCIRNNGQTAGLIEGAIEVDEEADMTTKSYVQTQVLIANKWLHKPTFKPQIKTEGEMAARNVIDIGKKMSQHLKEPEREEMRHLVEECEQLLTQCSIKYDLESGSVLMDRLKELAKAVDRCVVTMVVEDLIEDEEPMADLEILIDAERDEAKRKFVLERKIAELLAHLGRVTKTARVVADGNTDDGARELRQCSDQAALLAPMLVKAAEKRVVHPTEKAVVEEYHTQLAQYAESLSRVRDLCDRAVDPMQFVQTAEETMQRMKEESTGHQNDLQKCSNTSIAIRKLAHRVINVSMSSRNAQRDPELMRALAAAQQRLKDAEPSRTLRASKLPDWRNNIAEILRATGEVESVLGGEMIFKKLPEPDQPIYNAARNLHAAVREWSARDNEIVAVAKRMAVLMAKLSDHMHADKKRDVISTSKAIVAASHEVARLARKLALECTDMRIRTNLLQVCDQIPTISGQLKMLTTVKGSSLGHQGTEEDIEAMNMLVGNAQNLMMSIQDVVNAAASASVKIRSQRGGPRMRWVRKNYN